MKQLLIVLALVAASTGISQPFQNLDFEQYDPTTGFLPGWRLAAGTNSFTHLPLNYRSTGLGFASIFGAPSGIPYQGSYSLGLVPTIDSNAMYVEFTVIQKGDLPADARSIQFFNYGGPFELRLDDTVIALSYDYSIGPAPFGIYLQALVSGDISAFSGQQLELRFTTMRGISPFNGLDSIRFSPEPIPEPSVWALLGFGSLVLVLSRL